MRFKLAVLLIITAFSSGTLLGLDSWQRVSNSLQDQIANFDGEEGSFPVILLLKERLDTGSLYREVKDLPKQERRQMSVGILKDHSEKSQLELRHLLTKGHLRDEFSSLRYLWLINAIALETTLEGLKLLDKIEDIEVIIYDPLRDGLLDLYSEDGKVTGDNSARQITYNVSLINAPEVWDLGYTGQDIVVGVLDTGTNYLHHDLRNRMWEHLDFPYFGYNFFHDNYDTQDEHSHGTHCAGTIAGDGTSGYQTGVAPDSRIMTLRISDHTGSTNLAIMFSAIQFGVDNGTDVFSMSYGWSEPTIEERVIWRELLENILSIGVPFISSAGNWGNEQGQHPIPYNIRCPKDSPPPWLHPDQTVIGGLSGVISIGATDSNDNIAHFSSRGPVTWQNKDPFFDYPYNPGIGLIKPEVTAPGVNVTSLDNENITGYSIKSGTSMAAPAVAGLVALMLSKYDGLTPEEICQILEETAVSLTESKSNIYGSGRVDALAAVNAIVGANPPNPARLPNPANQTVDVFVDTGLRWFNGGGARSYLFSLGTDNPPTNLVYEYPTEATSFVPDEDLEYLTTYYWRIDSINDFGLTEGNVWSFATEHPISVDFEEGEFTLYDWTFTTSGANAEEWFIADEESYNGEYSARSGNIGHNSTTNLSVRIQVTEPGIITFYRKTSTELNYDVLRFSIDNNIKGEWSGESDWERVVFPVTEGFRTFRWTYIKDPLTTQGQDVVWIDDITFPPHARPAVIYAPHSFSKDPALDRVHLSWDIELNEDVDPFFFTLLGFNLYLSDEEDGEFEKLNEEPMAESNFVQYYEQEGLYTYYVTAQYRRMGQPVESEPSEYLTFELLPVMETPDVSHPSGEYLNSIEVEISAEAELTVFYTLDGSEPDLESSLYSEPILVEESLTLKIRGFRELYLSTEIKTIDYEIVHTYVEEQTLPKAMLVEVYPNPVRKDGSERSRGLTIDYYLPSDTAQIQVDIFNLKGQIVSSFHDVPNSTGRHQIHWDLNARSQKAVGSGIYLLRFRTDREETLRRVMLIK